ncbi:MAG: AhpC/TSA family protein [Bacteroidales bacterium]|nr:AhpC/TSA family protein [Bacteroidales bacterium]HOY39233.1 TlpA disulfide reductase family protein [Bacteroidales bacterium]HQP03562.1 TlpA disulfide reductase family protein [Bacteroidales bacterium]
MKNYVIVVILLVFSIVSCKNNSEKNDPNSFTIEGTIANSSGKTAYLLLLHSDKVETVDSVKIGDDNRFSITYSNEQVGFYILKIDKENQIYLIVSAGDTISVEGIYGKLASTYSVNGSDDSENARQLNLHMLESASKLDEFNRIYQAAVQNKEVNIDAVLKELDAEALKLYENDKLFLTNFIHKHEKSPVIYLALFQQLGTTRILNAESDMAVYEFTLEKMKQYHENLEQTKQLEKQINDYKLKQQSSSQNASSEGEAPDIELPTPDGEIIRLSSLRGQYVLLDFWASWCKPCRAESPYLVEAYKKYHEKGFEIYQVSLDSEKSQWVNAIKSDQLNWIHVSDLKYWDCAPAKVYGVNGIPANFLLDKNGVIIATNLRGKALEAKLSELLK